ncbi:MAG: glycosyltransferase [Vicinamibacterales bacterium]
MNLHQIFILVPSAHPTGPIKGAYALANALVDSRRVTLVTLKAGPGVEACLDERVTTLSLAGTRGGWRGRIRAYRELLRAAGGRHMVASISLLFSADLVNGCCSRQAVIVSSVRGNLVQNYRMDYGPPGVIWALLHLASLRRFDHITAMTQEMARQVQRYARKVPVVIGNFVDEQELARYRVAAPPSGPLRFVFVGSLTHRKQPLLVLKAVAQLRNGGVDLDAEVIGDGPLRPKLIDEIGRLSAGDIVRLHGHLPRPYDLVARADALVLPSISEGVSRAALEAMHLGVPVVMRAADGSAEVLNGRNGVAFQDDRELPVAMLAAARLSRSAKVRESLLPEMFRQETAVRQYLKLVK